MEADAREPPSAPAVGDADGLTVAQAHDTSQMVLGVAVEDDLGGVERFRLDDHVGARRTQRLHGSAAQENADLMRVNRPSFS